MTASISLCSAASRSRDRACSASNARCASSVARAEAVPGAAPACGAACGGHCRAAAAGDAPLLGFTGGSGGGLRGARASASCAAITARSRSSVDSTVNICAARSPRFQKGSERGGRPQPRTGAERASCPFVSRSMSRIHCPSTPPGAAPPGGASRGPALAPPARRSSSIGPGSGGARAAAPGAGVGPRDKSSSGLLGMAARDTRGTGDGGEAPGCGEGDGLGAGEGEGGAGERLEVARRAASGSMPHLPLERSMPPQRARALCRAYRTTAALRGANLRPCWDCWDFAGVGGMIRSVRHTASRLLT